MMRAFRHPFLEGPGFHAFAHRGGALENTENSMAAFSAAVAQGFRYLETDAYATKDGVLLAFHDDRLDRVTDRAGRIVDLSYATISQARLANGEPIPKLADVLGAFPNTRINIDAKSDEVVRPLIDLIRGGHDLDRLCIGSFSGRRLKAIRNAFGPRLCTALTPIEVLALAGQSRGFPSLPIGGQCAQIPVSGSVLGAEIPLLTPRLIEAAHKRGIAVHVWTIDDQAEMSRLIDLGVDGIMTDRPSLLRIVLKNQRLWAESMG